MIGTAALVPVARRGAGWVVTSVPVCAAVLVVFGGLFVWLVGEANLQVATPPLRLRRLDHVERARVQLPHALVDVALRQRKQLRDLVQLPRCRLLSALGDHFAGREVVSQG